MGIVVSKQEYEDILKEFHDSLTAGNYRVERTLQCIAKKYYFPGM